MSGTVGDARKRLTDPVTTTPPEHSDLAARVRALAETWERLDFGYDAASARLRRDRNRALLALLDEPEANVFVSGACQCGLPIMHADWGLACAMSGDFATTPPSEPVGTKADYLLDGSPEAVALVREARGLPPVGGDEAVSDG